MKTSYFIFLLSILGVAGKGGANGLPNDPKTILAKISAAPYRVLDMDSVVLTGRTIRVTRLWTGDRCMSSIQNISARPVRLSNIILFDIGQTGLDTATPIYGEGFQMVTQTAGTLGSPTDMTIYSDRGFYQMAEPDGERTVYNLFILGSAKSGYTLLGFTSSWRFAGRFSFTKDKLHISVNPEGLELAPGEKWRLEEFTAMSGADRNVLLDRFARYIQRNHPTKKTAKIPYGWCSYYFYGINSTRETVDSNIRIFSRVMPALRYMQIDEGYSPFEGDWLDYNAKFGSMDSTIADIRRHGFLPALWVAPFIAEANAPIFRQHPDWFIRGADGRPLNSATKGFGGWHNAPWYALDGTNPAAQRYLEDLFRTMRKRWGITYFKLDANYWGALDGIHFDPKATSVEAYRRGMEAIIRGAGADAIILGCNAPMWPSLGLVTAMRTSMDCFRAWRWLSGNARENFHRAWQNGRLWISDPDCLLLTGGKDMRPEWWIFHATAVHAVGGLVMDGDRASDLGEKEWSVLRKSIPPAGKGAVFAGDSLNVGITDMGDRQFYHCFNWSELPIDLTIRLKRPSRLKDYWTGEDLGVYDGTYLVRALKGQSARLIEATAVSPSSRPDQQ
ncbi:MAG TPA: glycoside hydrolase family 36 protein [Puia sp.]|jgi:alpha-galactosidase|nr:glycoside hydrolase family 36 protein [Puia sp.]